MRTLIVEDDFTSRLMLQRLLSRYGECHIATDGREAVEAFRLAQADGRGYDLICMDILMPGMDGLQAVHEIRRLEKTPKQARRGGRVSIIMTTASGDSANVNQSVQEDCDGYLLKPVDGRRLLSDLRTLGLLPF